MITNPATNLVLSHKGKFKNSQIRKHNHTKLLQHTTVQSKIDEVHSQSFPQQPNVCEIVPSSDTEAWESTLKSVDDSSRFLFSDWTQILKETYNYKSSFVVLRQENKIESVLPFTVVNSTLTGTRAISLPFFDICKAYAPNEHLIPKLHDKLKEEGRRRGWNYIELRGDIKNLDKTPSSLSFYNHIVNLSHGSEAVFDKLSSSNRRAIRKSQKDGVRVEFSHSLDALKGFYELQCITRKRHGLPSQPFKFFESIHRNLIAPQKGIIISAFVRSGQLAASSIYLEQGKTVHYKYGASEKRYQSSRCNNLVMWNALKHYSELGFESIDLGRNSIANSGLRRYKQSWGAKEKIVHYHRYDLKKNVTIPMTDDVFGWHNSIFKRLPNSLLKLAGRLLYKHIA